MLTGAEEKFMGSGEGGLTFKVDQSAEEVVVIVYRHGLTVCPIMSRLSILVFSHACHRNARRV